MGYANFQVLAALMMWIPTEVCLIKNQTVIPLYATFFMTLLLNSVAQGFAWLTFGSSIDGSPGFNPAAGDKQFFTRRKSSDMPSLGNDVMCDKLKLKAPTRMLDAHQYKINWQFSLVLVDERSPTDVKVSLNSLEEIRVYQRLNNRQIRFSKAGWGGGLCRLPPSPRRWKSQREGTFRGDKKYPYWSIY